MVLLLLFISVVVIVWISVLGFFSFCVFLGLVSVLVSFLIVFFCLDVLILVLRFRLVFGLLLWVLVLVW